MIRSGINMAHTTLIDSNDSALVVVDVQKTFTDKLAASERQPLINRICWIIKVARWLDIPIIVTAEDIPRLGSIVADIQSHLPEETAVLNKMVFGIAGNPEIRDAVNCLGRRTLVLVGLETDVCVSQSACRRPDMT
jgi:nicotinamidase-related amidase